ncbi:hypothetical protein NLJ89_g11232 [Agrocybe chaxingu]|uniref:DUF6532 domain-containing protein n=1 Tax=Agrocybe chaxingu TaxID=84603 RepID=A0A9W8MPJ7_9AGAR|nr:hypothetical protein NLJ89_g11232 [Agrocybe chaxingu]
MSPPIPAPESMLGTRYSSRARKNIHPGLVDAPAPRRSPTEMQELRQAEANTQKAAEAAKQAAVAEVARIEDHLQQEENKREQSRLLRQRPPRQASATTSTNACVDLESEDSSKDQDYVDEEENRSDEEEVGGKKKKRTAMREGIAGMRDIPASSVTKRKDITEDIHTQTKKKFKATNLPSGIAPSYRSSHAHNQPSQPTTSSDDNMAQYGGYVDDRETDTAERQALESGRGGNLSMIKIVHNEPVTMTQKAARGGGNKWTLQHLPPGTSRDFQSVLLPIVRKYTGTMNPWDTPSNAELQTLVDEVYGTSKYTVLSESVWERLIHYRLYGWRNGFVAAAADTLEAFIDNYRSSSFQTPEAIAEWVADMLEEHDLAPGSAKSKKTSPYQWREWNAGTKKKGFLRNYLIMETFAVAHLSNIPAYESFLIDDRKPIGALILSMQAVHHALQPWRSGKKEPKAPKLKNDKKTTDHPKFSHANYGDVVTTERPKPGAPRGARGTVTVTRRATLFCASVRNFGSLEWEEILEYAKEFVAVKGGPLPSSPAPQSAEAVESDDEFVVTSDAEDVD